jgi:cytochrome c biogenesis protein CcmG, thiol:disulfide interchange protein DsbE
MMPPVRPPLGALAAVLALAVTSGCAPGPGAAQQTGSAQSALPIVTPQPALVRKAHLDPCPGAGGTSPGAPSPSPTGRSARLPELTLPCLGTGRPVHLSDLRGVPTLVNVWYAACPPCRTEMPLLQRLQDQGHGAVRVLGIDYEDDPDSALVVLAKRGVTYPSVMDQNGTIRPGLPLRGTPTTAFVDADGAVRFLQVGQLTSWNQLTGLLRQHLGVTL